MFFIIPFRHFCADVDFKSTKKFQTKQQLLHRLQEGISFGDGIEYTPSEYLQVSSERTSSWKTKHYPDHDLLCRHADSLAQQARNQVGTTGESSMPISSIDDKLFTPTNIERDYWDIVEKSKEVIVEYGNDVDTQTFNSGFPMSERGRALNGTKDLEKMDKPEPRFGHEDYYKETWWNLNNIPGAPGSVLRHVKVGITGISKKEIQCRRQHTHMLSSLICCLFLCNSVFRRALDVLWFTVYNLLLAQRR